MGLGLGLGILRAICRPVGDGSEAVHTLALLSRITQSLAARTGQLLNMQALASDAGVSDKTVKHWLLYGGEARYTREGVDVMSWAGLLRRASPHY